MQIPTKAFHITRILSFAEQQCRHEILLPINRHKRELVSICGISTEFMPPSIGNIHYKWVIMTTYKQIIFHQAEILRKTHSMQFITQNNISPKRYQIQCPANMDFLINTLSVAVRNLRDEIARRNPSANKFIKFGRTDLQIGIHVDRIFVFRQHLVRLQLGEPRKQHLVARLERYRPNIPDSVPSRRHRVRKADVIVIRAYSQWLAQLVVSAGETSVDDFTRHSSIRFLREFYPTAQGVVPLFGRKRGQSTPMEKSQLTEIYATIHVIEVHTYVRYPRRKLFCQ